MPVRLKPLSEQTIVITGASSGIGLATARLAAQAGAKLVLASRNEEALTKIVDEIHATGGEAVSIVADVASEQDVERIAEAASGFGGVDTWINNAGTSIYGRVLDVPLAEQRRLFDTNFWGVVHGSRVAARLLKQRGGGAIINLGSVVSERTLPLQGTYSATKHAVKAFTDALRMELEQEGAAISVTLIKPTGIATPFAEHARSHLEHAPKLPPPVYHPQVAARAILRCAVTPRRDVLVGGGARLMSLFEMFFPRATDRLMEKAMFDQQQRMDKPGGQEGVLDRPADAEGEEVGDYQGHIMRTSAYTAASLHPVASLSIAVGAIGLLAAILGKRRAPGAPGRDEFGRGAWSALDDQRRAMHGKSSAAEHGASERFSDVAEQVGSPYEFVP